MTRCTCGLIDVHAHCLPPFYKDALAAAGLVTLDGGFPIPDWSPDTAIDVMDRGGIDAMVLSVSSPSVHFLSDQGERLSFARRLNNSVAVKQTKDPAADKASARHAADEGNAPVSAEELVLPLLLQIPEDAISAGAERADRLPSATDIAAKVLEDIRSREGNPCAFSTRRSSPAGLHCQAPVLLPLMKRVVGARWQTGPVEMSRRTSWGGTTAPSVTKGGPSRRESDADRHRPRRKEKVAVVTSGQARIGRRPELRARGGRTDDRPHRHRRSRRRGGKPVHGRAHCP